MQKQPVKTTTRNMGQTNTTIQINKPRNNKEDLRGETNRKASNNHYCTRYSRKRWCYQQGSAFFYSKATIKTTGERKGYPQNLKNNRLFKKRTEIYSNAKTKYHRTKTWHPRIHSKLRLTEFFHSENLDSSQETRKSVSDPLVKYKSNFYPPRNRNKFLDK